MASTPGESRIKHSPVVVIPTHTPSPSHEEKIAFQQCLNILGGKHRIVLVCPKEMPTREYEKLGTAFEVLPIPGQWLATLDDYNALKCSSFFYSLFADHDFLLTYELDSFVFRDELAAWCQEDYDYIGAPWFAGWYECTPDSPIIGVGNSGFSLRKVESCLRVIRKIEQLRNKFLKFGVNIAANNTRVQIVRKISYLIGNRAYMRMMMGGFIHEDRFWCQGVGPSFPNFRVAPPDAAMRFSFESNAPILYQRAQRQLPFGCHAWPKHQRDFWRPFILAAGFPI